MKLLVLDGNSIVNRAFYGIKLLSTKDGQFTNAIYGFLTMLEHIRKECEPDGVAIAFDRKEPTFRHVAYAAYKAGRKGMPEELAQQMPVLKELLGLLGYPMVECAGWEADDILGTLAKACRDTGNECVIATGDRDSLQLVGQGVTVRLAVTKFGQPQVTLYDEEAIREQYGVTPKQMIDIKALQGDSSDNIPGVKGIGPKGAGELIQKYGSVDYIYKHLPELDIRPALRKKLEEGEESARLSYDLGTIRLDAPIDTDLTHYHLQPGDRPAAARLMARLELFKLIDKLGLSASPEPADSPAETDETSLPQVLASEDAAALLPRMEESGKACLLPIFDSEGALSALYLGCGQEFVKTGPDVALLRALCRNERIEKCVCDAKPLFAYLLTQPESGVKTGIRLENLGMDLSLAGYLLNPSGSGYDPLRLMQEYGLPVPAGEDDNEKIIVGMDSLWQTLKGKLEENGQMKLLTDIELPLCRVLAVMEREGFLVDADGIRAYGEKIQQAAEQAQHAIWDEVGYEFNVNSPKQLGEALFGKLGLPHGKKTKNGYSTNADVLEKLRYESTAVENVLQYRTYAKLKSTYCDGLLKVIGPDGRIHSRFNQTETRTGRISSTEPNLQNIPVRTELGREMRRFFTARPGWVLVDADYSQIELRVLAHMAQDTNMIEAFRENRDIHRATAAKVFHLPEDMVTPLLRSRAKAVNFGIVYGIGAYSLSQDIGVSRKEADAYINGYLELYSGVRDYMERVVQQAKETGYVQTLFGRRRYLPELSSSSFPMRAFGERVARNMPIQGTAADIIKIAMVRVQQRLEKEQRRARLILQVHDELIVEAPQEEADAIADLLTQEMEAAVNLSVPMKADAHVGKTWYDAKG